MKRTVTAATVAITTSTIATTTATTAVTTTTTATTRGRLGLVHTDGATLQCIMQMDDIIT